MTQLVQSVKLIRPMQYMHFCIVRIGLFLLNFVILNYIREYYKIKKNIFFKDFIIKIIDKLSKLNNKSSKRNMTYGFLTKGKLL